MLFESRNRFCLRRFSFQHASGKGCTRTADAVGSPEIVCLCLVEAAARSPGVSLGRIIRTHPKPWNGGSKVFVAPVACDGDVGEKRNAPSICLRTPFVSGCRLCCNCHWHVDHGRQVGLIGLSKKWPVLFVSQRINNLLAGIDSPQISCDPPKSPPQ